MSSNPLTPSFRRVHNIPSDAAHPRVVEALRDNDKSITDLNQAIRSLKSQLTAASKTTAAAVSETVTAETVSQNWQFLGTVSNQLGSASYTTKNSDDGAKILIGDSTPVTVTLNPSVTRPWFAIIGNDSSSGVTLVTPLPAKLSGIQHVDPGCFVFVHYDGSTFWSEGIRFATDSTAGVVQPDDNTLVIDPITGYLRTNPAYGDMYTYNGSQVVTIAVIDTFVQIPGGISAGQTRGFTFQSAKQLQCNVAGKYLVNWSLAIHMGSNNQEVEGCVMVNGAAQTPTACHTEVINSAKPAAMSGTGILTLAVNDLLQMAVANHTATNNVTIDHLTLSALQIA